MEREAANGEISEVQVAVRFFREVLAGPPIHEHSLAAA
jgi:hypothetical protein